MRSNSHHGKSKNKQTQEILKRKTAAFFVLDLRFDIVNRVTGLNVEGDCFAGQSFDEDLHSTSETQHQVERGLLLNVVIRKRAPILQLFAGEYETLLIWRNASGSSFFVFGSRVS